MACHRQASARAAKQVRPKAALACIVYEYNVFLIRKRTAPWTGGYLLRVFDGAWRPAYSTYSALALARRASQGIILPLGMFTCNSTKLTSVPIYFIYIYI